MAMSRGGMGKEVAGARMKKRAMGASRQGKKMAPAEMSMPPMAMKKGGKVDLSKIVQDKKTGKLSEKPAMKMMGGGAAVQKLAMGGMAMKGGAPAMVPGKRAPLPMPAAGPGRSTLPMPPSPQVLPRAMKKGGMACSPKAMKKGGMALMIVLGKGDGKGKKK